MTMQFDARHTSNGGMLGRFIGTARGVAAIAAVVAVASATAVAALPAASGQSTWRGANEAGIFASEVRDSLGVLRSSADPSRYVAVAAAQPTTGGSTFAVSEIGEVPIDVVTTASVSYFFRLTGAAAVPVTISGLATAAIIGAGGGDSSASNLFYLSAAEPLWLYFQSTRALGVKSETFLKTLLLTPGTQYQVQFYSAAEIDGRGTAVAARAGASIFDVAFALDPAAGQTLEFSPGVFDAATALPEPATWATMVAGFGLVGGAVRRRHAVHRRQVHLV